MEILIDQEEPRTLYLVDAVIEELDYHPVYDDEYSLPVFNHGSEVMELRTLGFFQILTEEEFTLYYPTLKTSCFEGEYIKLRNFVGTIHFNKFTDKDGGLEASLLISTVGKVDIQSITFP